MLLINLELFIQHGFKHANIDLRNVKVGLLTFGWVWSKMLIGS